MGFKADRMNRIHRMMSGWERHLGHRVMLSSTRNRQFIYPQMAPMAQIDSQNCRGTTLDKSSTRRCMAQPVQAPYHLRDLRHLRTKPSSSGSTAVPHANW